MNIICPNCHQKTKVRNVKALRQNNHYCCQHCTAYIYILGSGRWGDFVADFVSETVGFAIAWVVFFLVMFVLPGIKSPIRIIVSAVLAIGISWAYLKCIAYLRIKLLQLEVESPLH